MEFLGTTIRKLRIERKFPLRKVASRLKMDTSFLSKIERNLRRPTREQILQLAKIFGKDEKDLMVNYLSDKVAYQIAGEPFAKEALEAAEEKVEYLRRVKKGMPDRKTVIAKIQNYLKKTPVEKAWLFGSFGRNEQDFLSDVDILVRFIKPNKITLFDYVGFMNDLQDLIGIKVDLAEEGQIKTHSAENVENEKILIYEKNPGIKSGSCI